MLIQGTVTSVGLPHATDQYGNSRQWVTVDTQAGPIMGEKSSKQQLSPNFVGQYVEWDCVSGTTSNGQPCNKFRRPKQQPPQQRPMPANQHQQDVPGKVRHGVVCAYIAAGKEPEIDLVNYWQNFIMTGIAPPPPGVSEDGADDPTF